MRRVRWETWSGPLALPCLVPWESTPIWATWDHWSPITVRGWYGLAFASLTVKGHAFWGFSRPVGLRGLMCSWTQQAGERTHQKKRTRGLSLGNAGKGTMRLLLVVMEIAREGGPFFLWMAILCHPCLSIPEKRTTRKGSLGRSPFLMQYERQTRGKATDRRTLDSRYVPVAANAAATVADIGVEVDGCLNVLDCLYPAFFSANLWLRPLYVTVFVDILHRKVHERKLEWKRAKVRGNRVDNRRYSESKKSFMFIGLSIQLASIRNRLETSNVVLLNTRHVFLD